VNGVWIAHSIIVGQEQAFEVRLARGGGVSTGPFGAAQPGDVSASAV
jgi:hypothetical protein